MFCEWCFSEIQFLDDLIKKCFFLVISCKSVKITENKTVESGFSIAQADTAAIPSFPAEVLYILAREYESAHDSLKPKFHTEKSQTYDLTVVDTANLLTYSGKYYYFKNIGTYDMIINLKTFEISVEKLPE